jgi:hypothetical protein
MYHEREVPVVEAVADDQNPLSPSSSSRRMRGGASSAAAVCPRAFHRFQQVKHEQQHYGNEYGEDGGEGSGVTRGHFPSLFLHQLIIIYI